jgi:DNA-binding MarR family transcriptional regulator
MVEDDQRSSQYSFGMHATVEQVGVLEERRTSPGLLLALVGHVAMRRLREAHAAHDLSPRQFHLLGLLHDHGAMRQSELGRRMAIDPSIMVTMLNPLESDGLITRRRDLKDRRHHHVSLTAAGARKLARAADAQRETEDALLSALDETQREQLRDLLMAVEVELEHDSLCSASVGERDTRAEAGGARGR